MSKSSRQAASSADGPRPVLGVSRRRRRIFAAILLLLPFVLLLALEGICRWRGFGGYPPVILHVGSDGKREWYSTYRPGVDSFFYTRLSHTGGMRELHFTAPKPAGTVRIALFGGSAMQGYPQPLPLTNGAFLEAMLDDVWGGRQRAEVLNLGATAMASFPAIHFLEAMLDHDLDLVVVMSGNNEFYGAYGVCSLHTSGTSPAGMRLARWSRGLGLTQWLAPRLQPAPAKEEVESKTLMERVAVRQQVAPDDALRSAAACNLQVNLTRMIELCTERKVPIVVCTPPTNERDLAPVGQELDPPLPDDQRERFKSLLAAAETGGAAGGAVATLREAIGLYPDSARTHYLLARALTTLGCHEEARPEYVAARDLDTMPWRATSAARQAILSAAAKGAVLCDMEAAFQQASPGGAIGWELMDDHVHMSLRGQALFAETLLDTMAKLPGPFCVNPEKLAALPEWTVYAERLGSGGYDEYVAASRVRTLFDIPFMRQNNLGAYERSDARCRDLLGRMSERDRQAVEHWRDPGLHVSNHRPLTFVVGYYRMMDGDCAAAARLFRVARESVSTMSLWRLQLTWYLLKCRRELGGDFTDEDRRLGGEGIEVGELLRRFAGFRDPLGPSYLGMIYSRMGRHAEAVALLNDAVRYAKGREGFDVVRALAESLIQVGRPDDARLLLNLSTRDAEMADLSRAMLANLDREFAPTPQSP